MTDHSTSNGEAEQLDIAIIGAGFVGLALTWLLIDSYGIPPEKIALFEKRRQRWVGPRAAGTGDDSIRFLRTTFGPGKTDAALQTLLKPGFSWTWRNSAGEVLYNADWNKTGPSGFDVIVGMHQPDIEEIAEELIRSRGVSIIRFDHDLQELQQNDSGVDLTFSHRSDSSRQTRIRAMYVVGADSAASPTRELNGIKSDDTGFEYDWSVVDLANLTPEGLEVADKLGYFQLCTYERPLTCVWSGPKRRRFEFMKLPDESKEELASIESAWRLLEPFGLNASNCEIERSAVYTFRARLAQTLRAGRCVLAGDAAHLTPPFLGQGLQMGMRDAASLAWRLSLITKGLASDALLNDYSSERRPPCRFLIDLAVQLGRVICVESAEEEKIIHEDFKKREASQVGQPPLGGPGNYSTLHPLGGRISLHRRVRDVDGKERHLDDVQGGRGWRILLWETEMTEELSTEAKKVIEALGVDHFVLKKETDATGDYATWFADEVKGDFVLIRPDFYVATAGTMAEMDDRLVEVGQLVHGLF